MPARYVPPSGFDYPLDGLLPSNPCRFCFTPTALLGFTLRSFPLSKGIRHVTARKHPLTVFPPGGAERRSERPDPGAAVPGFQPFRESLAIEYVLSAPTTGCSLGFLPFQGTLTEALIRISPDLLSRASQTRLQEPRPPAPQSLSRRPSGPARRPQQAATYSQDNPHRVSAP